MDRMDALSSAAMALMAGMAFTAVSIWIAGYALAVAWPGWYAGWAEQSPDLALRVWDCLIVLVAWVLPGALIAWIMVRPGQLGDWRYSLLAPLPALLWFVVLPLLDGRAPELLAEFMVHPLSSALQTAAVFASIPLFSWLFARWRPGPAQ